jgi:hypothetical protein
MYEIKVTDRQTIRWYKADSEADAMALFNILSKAVLNVELWQGSKFLGSATRFN